MSQGWKIVTILVTGSVAGAILGNVFMHYKAAHVLAQDANDIYKTGLTGAEGLPVMSVAGGGGGRRVRRRAA